MTLIALANRWIAVQSIIARVFVSVLLAGPVCLVVSTAQPCVCENGWQLSELNCYKEWFMGEEHAHSNNSPDCLFLPVFCTIMGVEGRITTESEGGVLRTPCDNIDWDPLLRNRDYGPIPVRFEFFAVLSPCTKVRTGWSMNDISAPNKRSAQKVLTSVIGCV